MKRDLLLMSILIRQDAFLVTPRILNVTPPTFYVIVQLVPIIVADQSVEQMRINSRDIILFASFCFLSVTCVKKKKTTDEEASLWREATRTRVVVGLRGSSG